MNTPNKDQQNASDELFKFLISPDQKEFSIRGSAGVGKTFLLQMLIKDILPKYRQACQLVGVPAHIQNVALTATTNRAADVLSGSFSFPAQTIHSFMNLKVYEDFDTGRQRIQKTGKFKVHQYYLIIIDEASMISREMYQIIQDGTDSTCKIIYVGDDKQLAPVGERVSIVFSNQNIKSAELKTPIRNAGQPALMALCQQYRETVETGIFKPLPLLPGVIDQLTDAQMQMHVDTVFQQEGAPSRILAYTNNQVIDYNNYIRHNRGYGIKLANGELVVNNTAVEAGSQGMISAEREFIAQVPEASDELLVMDDMEIWHYPVTLKSLRGSDLYHVRQPLNREFLQQVMKYYSQTADWRKFYRLKNMFPDLRARDSSTVYKAQGSTFDSVYIDLQNIGTSNMANQVARMLYVAFSRAKERVFVYGRLPDKYLGG